MIHVQLFVASKAGLVNTLHIALPPGGREVGAEC